MAQGPSAERAHVAGAWGQSREIREGLSPHKDSCAHLGVLPVPVPLSDARMLRPQASVASGHLS